MKWVKKMKKAFNKRSRALKKSMPEPKKGVVSTLLVGTLFLGSVGFKKDIQADNGGRILGLGATGALVGGLAGGGRGAGIGAATGIGLGLLTSDMGRSNGSNPYRQLNRIESKRDRAMNRADMFRAKAETAKNERMRSNYMEKAEKYAAAARMYDNRIARMKANLGMK